MIFDIKSQKSKREYKLQDGAMKLTAHDTDTEETFDVVKKRKAIDSAPPPSGDQEEEAADDPSALTAFEAFERSVLPALERVRAADEDGRRAELLELEDRIARGLAISATGGVYFAWSDCLGCMKIGATRREDPGLRLRELSRHVTSPFRLAAWLPTPTPFRLEARAHAHFAAQRIRAAGAGTEFFRIGDAEAAEFLIVADFC
jgi:hypothetical protein